MKGGGEVDCSPRPFLRLPFYFTPARFVLCDGLEDGEVSLGSLLWDRFCLPPKFVFLMYSIHTHRHHTTPPI